jgi:hypothetical protein
VRVIAALGWYNNVAAERGARLQLNDIAAGCASENLLDTFPGTYRPSLPGCRGIFQRALYMLPGQLGGTIEILAIGRHGGLPRSCGPKWSGQDQQEKNKPWGSRTPAGNLHIGRPLLTTVLISRFVCFAAIHDKA